MKSTTFLKSFSGLVLLNVLVKPLWIFGIDRQLQVLVGHKEYGTYFSILSLAIILGFLADAGITNMVNRQLAMQEPVQLGRLLRFKAVLVIGYCAIVALVAALTGIERWDIVWLVCAIQAGTSFLLFYRNILTGHQRFTTDAWMSILDKLLIILAAAPFLYPLFAPVHIELTTFLWLQTGTVYTTLLVAALLTRRYFNAPSAQLSSLKEVVRLTLPFSVLVLLMSVHNRLDAFLLERVHSNGAFEAGVYATAYRLLDAGNTVGFLAASFLLPYVSRHRQHEALVHETVLKLRHLLLLASIALLAFVAIYAWWITDMLYSIRDAYHSIVLIVTIAVLPAYFLIHIYGSLLTAKGLFRQFIRIVGISVVINIVLNLLLIHQWGALGCAGAALVSQYGCAGACLVVANRAYNIRPQVGSYLLYGAVGALLFGVFYAGAQWGTSPFTTLFVGSILTALIMFAQINWKKGPFSTF
jgi:O-antigen/teichoic acid export membrane protein